MAAAPFISTNFWQRIAEETSPFYPDYLAFQSGKITQAELIERLPHVAMIGDSVCMDMYISSAWNTFWRARTHRGKNWFLDRDRSPPVVRSVSKRLEAVTPFVAREYAGIGALVDDEREREIFFRHILGTRNLSGQIAQLMAANRFPDLILISIGHNNVDWAWRCPPDELKQSEDRLHRLSKHFCEKFGRQIRILIAHARKQRHRSAMVIYGLVNFERYFVARETAERLRAEDPTRYPHLETTYEYFTSFRPAYRRNLIRLARMINDGLRPMVEELNREIERVPNVQVRYSDALATADLSRVELLHEVDGWHASAEGHNVLAAAAFNALGPSLEFLGLNRAPVRHPVDRAVHTEAG
jgi:lysophospholipase L1-like esterase